MSISDPYQWRESVLSTRSMSYASTLDALEAPRGPVRTNTVTSMASLDEEDHHQQQHEHQHQQQQQQQQHHHHQQQLQLQRHQHQLMPSLGDPDSDPDTDPDASTSCPSSVSSSPLFLLPRDIRDQIWTFLVRSDTELDWPTESTTQQQQQQPPPPPPRLSPQVLLTCKAVYAEAARALYTTNSLAFGHPSDANMFVHALASPAFAPLMPRLTLRIRSQDTRLWTAWFNTNCAERSLTRDFPALQLLTIRYRGPRWSPQLSERANADAWLKDPRLQEIILSVRKCVTTVRLLLCVRLPADVVDGLAADGDGGAAEDEDRLPHVMFRRWAWLNGCYIRVEPICGPEE